MRMRRTFQVVEENSIKVNFGEELNIDIHRLKSDSYLVSFCLHLHR